MTQPTTPTPPTPPTPPVSPPEPTPEVKLDTTPQNYYQAIGWLRGKLVQVEDRFQIQVKESLFPLYLPRKVIAVANNHIDQIVWIKCYPQSKGEGLSFKGVWMGTEQVEKGEAGIFVLRGVWQFIPQCRRPVFTIYRNELKDYENRPSNQFTPDLGRPTSLPFSQGFRGKTQILSNYRSPDSPTCLFWLCFSDCRPSRLYS